ncbi:MAG: cytochrome c maturation protein CcmE [Ilumatobacteraceae bacterium]|nr:cytochrome c maturation protein CcmE [Ilumatobacteraceae bacterium]
MDLTPRTNDESSVASKKKRRWIPIVMIVAAMSAGGVVVTKFLTSAIDYYCNVDEVGSRPGCEGDRRLRVQGIVEEGSVQQQDGGTSFVMVFNLEKIKVVYAGDPGGVFQECIPVVAHGRVVDGTFESDRIEVKHSNSYVEKNKTRLDTANEEAAACSVLEG